jgi:hypothetical protein
MSDLDRKLDDLVSDDRITVKDADIVRTFQQFLIESGPAPDLAAGKRTFGPNHPLHTREDRQAYLQRWGPYLRGEADGPIEDGGQDR